MTTDPSDPAPLEITRPMFVAILVVMGIGALGALDRKPVDRYSKRPGYVFGHWSAPEILRLSQFPARPGFLPVRINAIDETSFFVVDHPSDGAEPTHIAFIQHSDSIAGEIRRFDPERDTWPPAPARFGLGVDLSSQRDLDEIERAVETSSATESSRMRVESIDYPDVSIEWTCLRRPASWPLRVHIGRIESDEDRLIVTLFEFDAVDDRPDYRDGPLGKIGRAIAID